MVPTPTFTIHYSPVKLIKSTITKRLQPVIAATKCTNKNQRKKMFFNNSNESFVYADYPSRGNRFQSEFSRRQRIMEEDHRRKAEIERRSRMEEEMERRRDNEMRQRERSNMERLRRRCLAPMQSGRKKTPTYQIFQGPNGRLYRVPCDVRDDIVYPHFNTDIDRSEFFKHAEDEEKEES
mmetsp:Transcript_25851/g.46835  ORF Transcript_25851/g.46835 Transcript_25851/m.46835 type:complete len:180 (+) Transcript_25851:23-562(+)